ncbi:hypothetical protein [Methylobacter marinus]|uniref:hypothetical protein n=1 Tax=Methylobacter marinus TaxID=34058 RepID=UPI00035C1087|nr:hypothetical protein [Methylobacter marinus]
METLLGRIQARFFDIEIEEKRLFEVSAPSAHVEGPSIYTVVSVEVADHVFLTGFDIASSCDGNCSCHAMIKSSGLFFNASCFWLYSLSDNHF